MNWAKRAAEEIVSDDVIDEADAEKSSSQDWLKWTLAAAALGTAGFAAWKYSPEIQKALESTRVYSDKALSNRLLEKVPGVGAVSSSPAAWGGLIGATGQLPGMHAAVRENAVIGKDSALRTWAGQIGEAAKANKPVSGGFMSDRVTSELAEKIHAGIGGNDAVAAATKLHGAGVKAPDSALGKLRTVNFDKPLTGDWNTHKGQMLASDVGLSRGAAGEDFDRLTSNAVELDRRLGSSITYQAPQLDAAGKPVLDATGAPVMAPRTGPLRDVPDADRVHLAPEHRFVWDAQRHAATEAGADPLKFRLGDIGKGLSTNRASLRRGFTIPHFVRGGAIGVGTGATLGFGLDLTGKALGTP